MEDLNATENFVILPLYSPTEKAAGREPVPIHSHCNQWNADGRLRDNGEIYISIPSQLRVLYPDFFPGREVTFTLQIANGQKFSAKICQDEGKALMTNPNNALEPWLLREKLQLAQGELLTYQRLADLGFDSVKVIKIGDGMYLLDSAGFGDYERFIAQNS